MVNLQDFMVSSGNSSVFSSCGKRRGEMYEQLVGLGNRETARVNGDGAEVEPEKPQSRWVQGGNFENLELGNGDEEEMLHKEKLYTFWLMLPKNDEDARVDEGDLLWDCNPTHQTAQIWDFQIGPHPQQEAGYDAKDPCFTIKNYCKLTKEVAFNNTTNMSNDVNVTQSPVEPSSEAMAMKAKRCNIPTHVQEMEKTPLSWVQTEDINIPQIDMQFFALNRGNAMLRYKEKKKTRRVEVSLRNWTMSPRPKIVTGVTVQLVQLSGLDENKEHEILNSYDIDQQGCLLVHLARKVVISFFLIGPIMPLPVRELANLLLSLLRDLWQIHELLSI